uniref:Cytochrome c oxidase subunit 7A1, mitochondrial n=1 Tax=Equus caballus TaxID=9796 RepID=A0A9L0RE49_HORSE
LRPKRRTQNEGPAGSPPPLVLAVRILALRHSLPGNRTVPTSGTQRARPLPPAPSRTHFGTPLWLPPIPPTRSLQVSPALVRSFSSTARNRFENRVAEKQKLFQADNDLPVHLKGGATDNILYRVTMGLCLGGTAYSLYCLGWASFPHKK